MCRPAAAIACRWCRYRRAPVTWAHASPPHASPLAPLQITGRAVILPKMMCGMDRWWAPHDGTIPGSGLELPYLCPADHVLDLEA